MLKVKFLVVSLLLGIIISCSEDETQTKINTLELKFPSLTTTNGRSSDDTQNYIVIIKSTSPLEIVSNELTVTKAVNAETGELSSVIIQNSPENLKASAASRTSQADPGIKRGYMYDGNDCFVWGTVITASNGSVYFYPADATTQLLMNRCGYANVA